MPDRTTKGNSSVVVQFRVKPERREILQLIADAETNGNVSELLRDLADRKIEERLRRRSGAFAASA